jgi:hypothetical protein
VGCGGGDSGDSDTATATAPVGPPLSSFFGKLPIGYRYAPAPQPRLERAFRAKIARDFGASPGDVETRNVYLGAQFVSGIAAVRASRAFTASEVANKVSPGHLPTRRIKIDGKEALLVVAVPPGGEADVAIVDTAGRVVLIVTAQRYPLARKIAARIVR